MELASVYERTQLRIGQEIVGPAIVEERESTTVIGTGDRLSVNEFGCLVVDLATTAAVTGETGTVPDIITIGGS
jgi:hypothetical protein